MPYTGYYAERAELPHPRHAGPVTDLPLEVCIAAIDEVLPALLEAGEDPQHA